MLKFLANTVSFVFHPLLIGTLLITILYFFLPTAIQPVNQDAIVSVLIMIFILTYVLPLFSVGMLRLTNTISSLRMNERHERFMPFLFVAVWYGFTTFFFVAKIDLGETFKVVFGAMTLAILAVAIISRFYKISAHTVGTAGLVGFLLAFHIRYIDSRLILPLVGALILHGLVSSARLYLDTHNAEEVHLGALLGFVINFSAVYFLT